MNRECEYRHALKFNNESTGTRRSSEKVVLNPIFETLNRFTSGVITESKSFLKVIRKFNSRIQLTSFGASNIVQNTKYEIAFKIQGYRRFGDDSYKFIIRRRKMNMRL